MIKIKIIEHFDVSDPKFSGDYREIEILINEKQVALFGDYYHDKGQERAEAFIKGLKFVLLNFESNNSYNDSDFKISKIKIADYEG